MCPTYGIPLQFMEYSIFVFYAFDLVFVFFKVFIGYNYRPYAHDITIVKLQMTTFITEY